ncbi:hypothetical protein EDD21DRAFT_132046 [Dissophora ornata]|nr:hypothetical protein EDD21DRAFT_132046 [Dissophora ornata]
MIKKSKSGVNAYLAAANAITILVRGGVRLDGIDLEGVRIPKDYLSGSYIDAAQLADSGLTAVELVQALLRSSDSRTEATAAQQHVQFAYRPGMIIENAKAESSNVRIDIDLRVSVSHSGTRADNQQYKRPNPPRHFQKDFTKSAMDSTTHDGSHGPISSRYYHSRSNSGSDSKIADSQLQKGLDYIKDGDRYRDRGDFDKAKAKYEKASKFYPSEAHDRLTILPLCKASKENSDSH